MEFEMYSTAKVSESGAGFFALASFRREGMNLSDASNIQKITRHDNGVSGALYFSTNTTINDFIVTKMGTMWAIDVLGHIHCSRPLLNGEKVDAALQAEGVEGEWSKQYISDDVPVCLDGEDDNLWIATHQGSLIHYDGSDFIKADISLIGTPIRIRRFERDHLAVMTNQGEILEYFDGIWNRLPLADDIPQNLTINDVAYVEGKLFAVSITGHILKCSDNGVFELQRHEHNRSWFSCMAFNNELHFAGEKDGAFKIDRSGQLVQLKVFDQMIGVFSGLNCLYFMFAEDKQGAFARYAPSELNPWTKFF
jgi:hypothetical protein